MALHIQNKGLEVVGVDLDKKQVAEAKNRGLAAGDDLASQVSDIDVFIVIVATDKQTESVVETILTNNPKKWSRSGCGSHKSSRYDDSSCATVCCSRSSVCGRSCCIWNAGRTGWKPSKSLWWI
jgi:hypothetical protein